MGKTRQRDGSVRWTDPTGRSWTSPQPAPAAEPAVRSAPGLRTLTGAGTGRPDAWASSKPTAARASTAASSTAAAPAGNRPGPRPEQDGCAHLDPLADRLELAADDPFDTPLDDTDVLGELILHGDGWGLTLDDPTRWES